MRDLETRLVQLFEQIARRAGSTFTALREDARFSVDDARWCFSLPDLYTFIRAHDNAFAQVDYLSFRRDLFHAPINQHLAPLGAVIEIVTNKGKVDESLYALVWKSPPRK